jgi:hypothetical protein
VWAINFPKGVTEIVNAEYIGSYHQCWPGSPVQLIPGNHTGDCWYQPGLSLFASQNCKAGGAARQKLVKRDKEGQL